MNMASHTGLCVLLVGAGNIGSPLVDLLAREPLIGKLAIIDADRYTEANRLAQAIFPADVGKPKAFVAARRARRIAGQRLVVRGLHGDLVDIPWGVYRDADVVFAALDSRRARADLALICWRMGRPLIDAGVNADSLLARTTLYLPGPDAPCYLCGTDDGRNLEAKYNCVGQPLAAPSTGAPAYLGTAAASLAVSEFHRLARGESDKSAGREIVLDLARGGMTTTTQRRSGSCSFDHRTWALGGSISGRLTIGRALELDGDDTGEAPSTLRVEGSAFVRKLSCNRPGCGRHSRSVLKLSRRLGAPLVCKCCGVGLTASAMDLADALEASLPPRDLRRTLASVGLRTGDVVTIARPAKDLHYRIGVKGA